MNITKTAMITVCGRPNVGKSDLTNALVGEKIAIVSKKPQTTRNRIYGVVNRGDTQFVLLDTPGLHKPRSRLGDYMVKVVRESLSAVECALLLVEPIAHVGEPERILLRRIEEEQLPVVLCINKVDTVEKKDDLLAVIAAYNEVYSGFDAANSGAVVNFRETCLDMVRPGLLLYGLYPGAERGGLDLKPVMRLLTRVAEITEHHAGDTISYGRIFTCERDMRLAVIPVGYADGLHRSLSGKFDVLINGKRAHQVGRICMDMCMVDVTDMPEVKTGDIVTVFGDEPEATELADIAGTISYELLCAISPRVPRVYIGA